MLHLALKSMRLRGKNADVIHTTEHNFSWST